MARCLTIGCNHQNLRNLLHRRNDHTSSCSSQSHSTVQDATQQTLNFATTTTTTEHSHAIFVKLVNVTGLKVALSETFLLVAAAKSNATNHLNHLPMPSPPPPPSIHRYQMCIKLWTIFIIYHLFLAMKIMHWYTIPKASWTISPCSFRIRR